MYACSLRGVPSVSKGQSTRHERQQRVSVIHQQQPRKQRNFGLRHFSPAFDFFRPFCLPQRLVQNTPKKMASGGLPPLHAKPPPPGWTPGATSGTAQSHHDETIANIAWEVSWEKSQNFGLGDYCDTMLCHFSETSGAKIIPRQSGASVQ